MPENQVTQRLAEIIARIAKLPSANLEPPQFFANYLQLTVAATGSRGGALWVTQPNQPPQIYCHVDLELCNIQENNQQKVILEAIGRTVKEGKPLVLPTGEARGDFEGEIGDGIANHCSFPLFFKPLRAARQAAMVLQLIGADNLSPHDFRLIAGLLEQVGEYAEVYLAHRRAAVLEDDRKALARLLQYTENVHGSLEPEKVVYQLANLGRDAIGCDRVAVWIDPHVKRNLRAVSGVDKPDKRAVQMQTIEKLCRHCLKDPKPIIAARAKLAELIEDEPLTPLLKDYFNFSHFDEIFVQPIKHGERYLGVLVAEGFDEQTSTNLAGMVGAVAKHGAVALANALDVAALPLVKPLARIKKAQADPKAKRKLLIKLIIAAVILIACALVPWPVKIESACEIKPANYRMLESPLEKAEIEEIVREAGQVKQGDLIAKINDNDLQTQLYGLEAELAQEKAKFEQARTTSSNTALARISQLQLNKLNEQIAYVKGQIERCQIRAPIDGTILTPKLKEMQGRTLNKGESICEIADLANWELVLDMPQEDIGWVQRGLDRVARTERPLLVVFYLTSYPEFKLRSWLSEPAQIAQMAQTHDKGNVFQVRVPVAPEQLAAVQAGLITGTTGQAKISTLERPLGYVLLRKVIRFFRVTFF